jgi:hypothetical protein
MTKLIFVDTETTGLDYDKHEVWEVAAIVREFVPPEIEGPGELRDWDTEYHWFLPVGDLKKADPFALNIGKFWERHPAALYHLGLAKDGWEGVTNLSEFAHDFWKISKDAHFIANVPDFDSWRIAKLIKENTRLFPMWHYHLVCCENLAAGKLGMVPPWKSDDVFEALGYKRNKETQHTAMGDAREVRDIYDLIMGT